MWLDQFQQIMIGSKFGLPLGLAESITHVKDLVFFVCEFIGWLETDMEWRLVIRSDWKMKSEFFPYLGRMHIGMYGLDFSWNNVEH